MLTIRQAMEAFIAGWGYSRSMERQITVSDVGGLTRVQFGHNPLLKPRPDEFMILDVPPDDVMQVIRPTFATIPHRLSIFTQQPDETLAAYTRYGYHLYMNQYLMAVDLHEATFIAAEGVVVESVDSEAKRLWFNRKREREVIPARALNDPHMGCYYVRIGDDLAAEGRYMLTPENITVMDLIYTTEAYRRQGLGSALMQRMLIDAAGRGSPYSALVASDDGRKLYMTLGYEILSDLLVLEPD
jgi:GNAT superfamily N-acetyltransferase